MVRLCVITKICEWIGPAYSANLLARAYNALKVAFTSSSRSSKVCPNRIDTRFLSIIFKDGVMKEKLLVIIRPNKIGGEQLENVFLFVQIYSIYTDFYWQTTTNRAQLNISDDLKIFMGKTVHTLGV